MSQELVFRSVDRIKAALAESPPAAGESLPAFESTDALGLSVRQTIRDLIELLLANLGNIDEEELVAILAKLEEAATALAAGRYWVAVIAAFAAWRLYRQAIKTPVAAIAW